MFVGVHIPVEKQFDDVDMAPRTGRMKRVPYVISCMTRVKLQYLEEMPALTKGFRFCIPVQKQFSDVETAAKTGHIKWAP